MRCIEARLRLEREKEQQENLILSVIPAHIGIEMNIEMIVCHSQGFSFLSSFKYEIGNVT